MCSKLAKETNLGRFFFSPDDGLESDIQQESLSHFRCWTWMFFRESSKCWCL